MLKLDQFPFTKVANWLSEGEVVPFLGAAASRIGVTGKSRLPTAQGLARELMTQMGGAFSGDESDDLAKVAQFFDSLFGRPELYDYLHDRFQMKQADAPVARVARLLATVPNHIKPLFIITTNYDPLVERAFQEKQRPLCVITQNMREPHPEYGAGYIEVKYPDGTVERGFGRDFQLSDPRFPLGSDPRFPPGTAFLFKMHGSAHRTTGEIRDDLIITEDDYVDFIINSGGPSSPIFPPSALDAAYKTRPFLFLGYSLNDWNFRVFLRLLYRRNTLSGNGQRKHFAIQLAPRPLEEQLWQQRNVNVFDGDLAEFCDRLEGIWAKETEEEEQTA
jgi:hypothetical protein